jgi:hypothetical protein
MRKRDIYGNMQRWIMTVKDHSSGLVYLCALPQKKAIYVAAELEKYFGLIGYPEIFHTGVYTLIHVKPISLLYFCFTDCIIYFFVLLFNSDNGKEFSATVVVDLLKESNPNCYIVTSCPRTPRDQGSVESANKVVQQVLKSILSENCLRSKEINWTKLLGQVMVVCNRHSGIWKNSVSSYEVVFGQKYHQQLQCSLSEMRECKLIFQR